MDAYMDATHAAVGLSSDKPPAVDMEFPHSATPQGRALLDEMVATCTGDEWFNDDVDEHTSAHQEDAGALQS